MTDSPEVENETLNDRNELKSEKTPVWREDKKMKTSELKVNEMEQVSGGNFFADLEDVLRRIFQDIPYPPKPGEPASPKPVTARGKC